MFAKLIYIKTIPFNAKNSIKTFWSKLQAEYFAVERLWLHIVDYMNDINWLKYPVLSFVAVGRQNRPTGHRLLPHLATKTAIKTFWSERQAEYFVLEWL